VLDLIERQVLLLASPHRQEFWQDLGPDAGGQKLRVVYTPPLLDQLRNALGSGNGTGAAGVGEKRTRAVLDSAAVQLWWEIQAQIVDWHDSLSMRRAHRDADPKGLLTAWLHLYKRQFGPTVPAPTDQDTNLRILSGWVTTIESKFDPPKTLEILAECPHCHQRYALSNEGDRSAALVALVHSNGDIEVACKSCRTTWSDLHEIRLLGERVVG
jgi:hypothetical protein